MFRDYVQNIATLLIFTSFLGIILPRGKYKGYVRLIAGLVVILAVVGPVMSFFSGRALDDFFVEAERQLGLDIAAQAMRSGMHFEDSMLRAVLDEHRAGLEAGMRTKISSLGYELEDARIYINETDESFGMIDELVLVLSKRNETADTSIIRVDRVRIDRIGIGTNAPGNQGSDECDEINAIKNLLADFYNLSVTNIHIIIN